MVAANALMIQGLTSHRSILAQKWTLAYFLAFYLACPLVVKGCNAARISQEQRIALLVQASIAGRLVFGTHSPWTFIVIGMLSAELISQTKMLNRHGQWALLGFSLMTLSLGETPVAILCWLVIANSNE